eukprot:s1291_g9.t1
MLEGSPKNRFCRTRAVSFTVEAVLSQLLPVVFISGCCAFKPISSICFILLVFLSTMIYFHTTSSHRCFWKLDVVDLLDHEFAPRPGVPAHCLAAPNRSPLIGRRAVTRRDSSGR